METTIQGLGFLGFRDITPTMENYIENVQDEMDTGILWWFLYSRPRLEALRIQGLGFIVPLK